MSPMLSLPRPPTIRTMLAVIGALCLVILCGALAHAGDATAPVIANPNGDAIATAAPSLFGMLMSGNFIGALGIIIPTAAVIIANQNSRYWHNKTLAAVLGNGRQS